MDPLFGTFQNLKRYVEELEERPPSSISEMMPRNDLMMIISTLRERADQEYQSQRIIENQYRSITQDLDHFETTINDVYQNVFALGDRERYMRPAEDEEHLPVAELLEDDSPVEEDEAVHFHEASDSDSQLEEMQELPEVFDGEVEEANPEDEMGNQRYPPAA